MLLRVARGSGTWSLLARHRDFRVLWTGESVSLLGTEISVLALPSVAVLVLHTDASTVGLVMALQWLPFVVLAPMLGVAVDRCRRRPLMQAANLARTLVLGSLPVMGALGALSVGALCIVVTVKGACDVLFQVAYQAYLPDLLGEDLIDGTALTQVSRSVAVVAGRATAGALVTLIGATATLVTDAASYLVAALAVHRIRIDEPVPGPAPHTRAHVVRQLRDGMVMSLGNRLLRQLVIMSACGNAAGSAAFAVTIPYAYDDLHLTAADLGLAMGTGSLTLLVGAATSRSLLRRWGAGRVLLLTNTLLGAAFLTLTIAGGGHHRRALLVVMASQALSGVALPPTNLAVMTLIPKIAPSRVLGRVIGAALPLVWGANALGPILGGTVAAATTPTTALLLSALLTAAAVTAILTGRLHRIHHDVPTDLQIRAAP